MGRTKEKLSKTSTSETSTFIKPAIRDFIKHVFLMLPVNPGTIVVLEGIEYNDNNNAYYKKVEAEWTKKRWLKGQTFKSVQFSLILYICFLYCDRNYEETLLIVIHVEHSRYNHKKWTWQTEFKTLNETVCISLDVNTLGKGMNLSLHLLSMRK